MLKRLPSKAAYTLIEVLVVVVILGLLGGIVVPSMLTAGEIGVQTAARTIVADLLVAQNEAVAAQASRTVVFDTANERYAIFDENGAVIQATWLTQTTTTMDQDGNDVTSPAGNYFITDFRNDQRFSGVDLSAASFAGSNRITFDALGSPIDGGNVDVVFGDKAFRITVSDFTGRLTVGTRPMP